MAIRPFGESCAKYTSFALFRRTIQALEACGVDLYLDQQAIDTPQMINVVKKRGRPPGSLNHKTRAIVAQALKDGITLPEAMLKLMRRWWKLAHQSGVSAL
jgi:hypothetical protein